MVMFETPDSKYLGMKRKPDAARGWRREERKFETLTQAWFIFRAGKVPCRIWASDRGLVVFVFRPSTIRVSHPSCISQSSARSAQVPPQFLLYCILYGSGLNFLSGTTLSPTYNSFSTYQNYVSLQWFVPNGLCLLEKNLAQTLDCGLLGLTG
jgi:hypothetical protein